MPHFSLKIPQFSLDYIISFPSVPDSIPRFFLHFLIKSHALPLRFLPLSHRLPVHFMWKWSSYHDGSINALKGADLFLLTRTKTTITLNSVVMNSLAPPQQLSYSTLEDAKAAIDENARQQGCAVRVLRTMKVGNRINGEIKGQALQCSHSGIPPSILTTRISSTRKNICCFRLYIHRKRPPPTLEKEPWHQKKKHRFFLLVKQASHPAVY